MKRLTLEEAISRIQELESEVALLKSENEKLRRRNLGGRKRHDDAWMEAYSGFISKLETGMSLKEIVKEGEISRRTAYRYLAYYRQLQEELKQ
ncbi:MAG: resolvase [Lachnospiraceae bacterium]|nr:resolvase [Lachnospiraceae bacterium]